MAFVDVDRWFAGDSTPHMPTSLALRLRFPRTGFPERNFVDNEQASSIEAYLFREPNRQLPEQCRAVAFPGAPMHASKCRGLGSRETLQKFTCVLAVREIIHLLPESFARLKNVRLRDRRAVVSGLSEEVTAK